MKVIHDDETFGLSMIPLIVQWGITPKCQVVGCEDKTNAILCIPANESPTGSPLKIGICEKHYVGSKVGPEEFRFNEEVKI